jgi:hypothetical protein
MPDPARVLGDQHHGGIAVAVASLPASIDQAGNLGIGEVLAGADLGVTFAVRRVGRSPTVPITVVGATSVRCGFVMIFQGSSSATVPNTALYGTLHKARNADFINTFDLGAAAKPVSTQETLNGWAFFTDATAAMFHCWPCAPSTIGTTFPMTFGS